MLKFSLRAVILFVGVLHPGRKDTAEGTFSCPPSGGFFPDPTDCKRFYSCPGGRLYMCPPSDPVFDAASQRCVVKPANRGNSSGLCPPTTSSSQSSKLHTSSSSSSSKASLYSLPNSVHIRSTPTLYQSDISAVSVTSSAMSSAITFGATLYTTIQKPSLSTSYSVSSSTMLPSITPSDWRDCRSKSFSELLDCFKLEARNAKERLEKDVPANITRKIIQATAKYADDVLDAVGSRKDSAEVFNAFDVVAVLEEIWKGVLRHMTNSTEKIRILTKNIGIESVEVNDQYRFPDNSLGPWDKGSGSIVLPMKLLSDDKYPCRAISALYWNLHSLVPTRTLGVNDTLKINSHVISTLLCVPVRENLHNQIFIVMKHLKVLDDNEYTYCAFWDFSISTVNGNGSWSREGCHVVSERSNTTHTVCSCNHLTNFAILMGSAEFSVSKANQFALSLITYAGCVLSLFGAVGGVVAFVMFTSLNTDRHIIHGNLLVAIAISQTIFLAGIGKTHNPLQCRFTAIMLHYFYLVSFGWMLCEGLHLYIMVVKVFNIASKIYHYVVFSWGIPAVIVLITAVCRYDYYGTETSCWISPERNTLLAFVIPITATIFANIVILGMVLNEICRLQTSRRGCVSQIATSTIKSLVVLFPLLGLSWLFGLLLFATNNIVFQYLFAVFNTLQGFFIFLLHCLYNSEIRKNFKRKKEAWKSMKAFHYLRKRFSASSVAPSPPHSSLSEKAATFKASSQ